MGNPTRYLCLHQQKVEPVEDAFISQFRGKQGHFILCNILKLNPVDLGLGGSTGLNTKGGRVWTYMISSAGVLLHYAAGTACFIDSHLTVKIYVNFIKYVYEVS